MRAQQLTAVSMALAGAVSCSFLVADVSDLVAVSDAGLVPPLDSATSVPQCTAAFNAPVLVPTPGQAAYSQLSSDERTLYFQAPDPSGSVVHLYFSTRPTSNGAFGSAQPIPSVNSEANDGNPSVSADGLTLYFTSNRPGGPGNFDIFVSKRSAPNDAFGPPVRMAQASSSEPDTEPYVAGGGRELWFRRSATIHRVSTVDPGDSAVLVSELNTAAEGSPVVSADGLLVLFARFLTPENGEIYSARRESLSSRFSMPARVAELNTPGLQWPRWISANGCRLYLERYANGIATLWMAERAK